MTARLTAAAVLSLVAGLLLCLRCAHAFSTTCATTCAPRGFTSLSPRASSSSSSSSAGDGQGRCRDEEDDEEDEDDVSHHFHQRRRRELVVRSIASATAGMVLRGSAAASIVVPLLDLAPALADDHDDDDGAIRIPRITHRAYLDVVFGDNRGIGGGGGGGEGRRSRLVIGLFGDSSPRTVKNFLTLCSNRDADGPSYVGSTFYRALSGNSIQGGAIGYPTGKSGTSSFENGAPFAPDNYDVRHARAGLVSAVRANANGDVDSRFFVQTEDDAGWADGRYAAFGIVLDDGDDKGMDLVRRISRVEVKTPQNSPKEPITIVGCGVLAER